jgi:hypothetical protein
MADRCVHVWKKTLLPKVEKCKQCNAYRRLFGTSWAIYDPQSERDARPKDEKGWQ